MTVLITRLELTPECPSERFASDLNQLRERG
jgi:hypothetical protein